jgi:hypothetical protein
MSAKSKPFKNRRHDTLTKRLRIALNMMQMRDWDVDLEYGDLLPLRWIKDDDDAMARVDYCTDTLTAFIWVSPERCKKNNTDPLSALYHEVAHIFLEVHNEEVRCNVIARLIWRLLEM